MTIPRPEYPRPQFVRQDWLCLNGEWQFEIDPGDSGRERGLLDRALERRIIVPFCPESTLSGIGHTDFMEAVWYRRAADIPAAWKGRRVMLHFQAVDYDATVWVNGTEVARHRGGFTPFSCDLSGVAEPGTTATIVVRARDPRREPKPSGKQSTEYASHGCVYTRTTGIWQTVWLEPVSKVYLKRARITPDVAQFAFHVVQPLSANPVGWSVRVTVMDGTDRVSNASMPADADLAPTLLLPIPDNKVKLWQPGAPHLYTLVIELVDAVGNVVDRVTSYAGMRSVTIDGMAVKINGVPVFQRQVLDQGYYPDGILTAPTDEALRRDIELSMAAGFNSARLHQKVFEERFLYHADTMGYLVWGEFADWGFRWSAPRNQHQHQPGAAIMAQWCEVLHRDYSHPSIIGWCPLNESHQRIEDQITMLDDVTHGMFLITKAMDLTRPVLDASGYSHRVPDADIYDSHDYDQNPQSFLERHAKLADGAPFVNSGSGNDACSIPWRCQPYFVSEFGGIKWSPAAGDGTTSWGYGDTPKTIEEFYQRFDGLCKVLLDNPRMFAYCYTQLTDVFQEQNGIYTFDRNEKFDMAKIRAAQQRPAAIEARK